MVTCKKIVLKRDPVYGRATDYRWACSVCRTQYVNQSDAQKCCADKKDIKRYPWLRRYVDQKEFLQKLRIEKGIKD